jgi:hypothetical protein
MTEILPNKVNYELVPGKANTEFRNYHDSSRQSTVERHYQAMRQHQTVKFVEKMEKKWKNFDHDKLTVREAFIRVCEIFSIIY